MHSWNKLRNWFNLKQGGLLLDAFATYHAKVATSEVSSVSALEYIVVPKWCPAQQKNFSGEDNHVKSGATSSKNHEKAGF